MHDCVNEMVIEDGTEVIGNKMKSKAKGLMNEHSAPAGDMATMTSPVRIKSIASGKIF